MNSAPLPHRHTYFDGASKPESEPGDRTVERSTHNGPHVRTERPGLAAVVRAVQDGREAVRRW